jgi:hypothetical protein
MRAQVQAIIMVTSAQVVATQLQQVPSRLLAASHDMVCWRPDQPDGELTAS